MPRKRRTREKYARRAADSTWPQARRVTSGGTVAGDHRGDRPIQMISATMPASTRRKGPGLSLAMRTRLEPDATPLQKKCVALVPKAVPPGTGKLSSRQELCSQVNGSDHCSFSFGPVGPLEKDA